VVHAVTNCFHVRPQGRRIGFIGESGSGKTTTALAAMRMLASPGFVSQGEIHLNSLGHTNVLALSDEEMRRVRLKQDQLHPAGRDELAQPGDADREPDLGRHRRP
jgi:peptide/nickel transport system ATP-binding protein